MVSNAVTAPSCLLSYRDGNGWKTSPHFYKAGSRRAIVPAMTLWPGSYGDKNHSLASLRLRA